MPMLPPLLWKASPNFSQRTAPIDLLVLHDVEGSYQSGIATFLSPASKVSAHLVLKEDGTEVTQMVEWSQKAWHVVDFNSRAIGLEMAGRAAHGFPAAQWQAAALIFATLLHIYKLPCQWAHKGVGPGFTSHYDLGKAGGGHSDPTTSALVWSLFVHRVERAYAAGGLPPIYGRGGPALLPLL